MVTKRNGPALKWLIGLAVVLLLAAAVGCVLLIKLLLPDGRNPLVQSTPVPIPVSPVIGVQAVESAGSQTGSYNISVRLSEGQAQPQAVASIRLADGDALSAQELEQILTRLPALAVEAGDQVDFKLAQDPIPPPLTGETITQPFPPEEAEVTSVTVDSGPLEVLRYAPEGEIPLAPFVNISFNQPMVPLGTLEALSAELVPVTIEPALPGVWRWLGTKTLTFEYDSQLIDRLPKATEYRVTIPAGTTSATGGVLAETVAWTFRTPPPVMVSSYPSDYEAQPLDPIFFVVFDQRIDPAAVLETIQVQAGRQAVSLVLATEAEVQDDQRLSQRLEYTLEGRWLAFKATEPFPPDTAVSVTIGPGTPSAEGPLVTTSAQSFSFSTYAPLRIEDHGCYWDDRCRPLSPFFIQFNNAIDAQVYTDEMLRIEPELPGASVNILGSTIQIDGMSQGQTTYTVVVDGDIQDVFGQTLGKDTELTFRVGSADPVLVGPDQPFITLDPAAAPGEGDSEQSARPVYSVYVINYSQLDVQIYAVQPDDWPAYKQYLRDWQQSDVTPKMPGSLVFDDVIRIETPEDKLTQVDIDLSPYLSAEQPYGHFVVVVAPPKKLFESASERYWRTIHTWVQVTQIGLDAFADHSEMVVWTTALQDGAPLSGVTVQAENGQAETVTDADGTARFPIPSGATYLVARQGGDQALLPRSYYYWGDDAWNVWSVSDELRWYVFDDRQMYRPGEEVHIKGWLRQVGGRQDGDVGWVNGLVGSVTYQFYDPQGNDLGSGLAEVNAIGGFDFVVTVPEAVNLGYAQLYLTAQTGALSGATYYHNFQIQEFRRPEFEVAARNETTGPYFVGDHAVVAVAANYYAGGALPNAEVTWQVTYAPSSYTPPNWPGFTFGTWQPWWWYAYDYEGYSGSSGSMETFSGKTDAAGTHYLRLDFDSSNVLGNNPLPYSVLASASVMDINRQAWGSMTSLLVHPANLYIGMHSERYFVERGVPLEIDFIVTDLDGNAVPDRPVELQAARMEWKYLSGSWQQQAADIQTCNAGSTLEPVTCTFETPIGGVYQITARVTDELGRPNQSRITRWVSGGQMPPQRTVEMEQATLIPDQESYQPGDVAHILVQSPFPATEASPAEGLLTVSRSGILYTQRFSITDGSITLEIPIEAAYIPNLSIQVDLTGSAPRVDDNGATLSDVPPRPAYATAQLTLSIPPLERALNLEVAPLSPELQPGEETTVAVTVRDANGQPVADAELAVVVVDEAILALTNYQMADPLNLFYSERYSYLDSVYSRASIILLDPQALANAASRDALDAIVTQELEALSIEKAAAEPMTEISGAGVRIPNTTAATAEEGSNEAATTPIRVRMDFNPLATFAPAVRTDANGQASVAVKLPDNLTRYRIMVVAVDDGSRFGMAESNLTARLPLMARPSAPRFLNFGDQVELPVVLQNQTDAPMEVSVVVQASNLDLLDNVLVSSEITAGIEIAGLRVTVPARDRVEVRFPATTRMAGTARLQIAAVSGAYADAATVEFPVYTPATTEAFATYGVVDEGAVIQPVAAPTGVFPQYGGLEINTSSTALQSLTDAVLYLVAYPYECSEQLASRILAVAALRDVLTAFEADGLPAPEEMESAVRRDIERLQGMQNYDGGFPYWRRGFDSSPFNTIHVAHALYRAQAKGFEVPAEMQSSVLVYLGDIESHYPAWYGQYTRWTLSAYALYVRNLMGDRDVDKALRLIAEAGLENLSLEAVGWLWPTLIDAPQASEQLDAIRRHINNRVVETAGAANFTTYYDEQTYLLLSSNRRTDAILLDALILDQPDSDLIPKLVNGLLAHRTRGRWGNTQENVFVLLALDRYFNTFEAQAPDFVARLWLGETYAGSYEFRGRTTARNETVIPMAYLVDPALGGGETQNLVLSKDGPGRLYYRLGLRYAPTDLNLPPVDMGFVVTRRYEAVDDPDDVYQDEAGVWHIKAGARVRVRVTMVADNRRYHVALVDPLPAGLEIVNPGLAVSQQAPSDPNQSSYGWWWWGWTWYDHQNMRDERAEAFATLLWDGVYEYTYIARATTPGVFVAPPAKAEEMYSPEVFGRSSSDWVVVEDR